MWNESKQHLDIDLICNWWSFSHFSHQLKRLLKSISLFICPVVWPIFGQALAIRQITSFDSTMLWYTKELMVHSMSARRRNSCGCKASLNHHPSTIVLIAGTRCLCWCALWPNIATCFRSLGICFQLLLGTLSNKQDLFSLFQTVKVNIVSKTKTKCEKKNFWLTKIKTRLWKKKLFCELGKPTKIKIEWKCPHF